MRSRAALDTITAALSAALFVCLLFFPRVVFVLFGMEGNESAAVMSRRASALFLGLAVMCWLARGAEASVARRALDAGLGVAMLGLAVAGAVEFTRGAVGPGVWLAVVVEVTIAVSYLRAWRTSRIG